MLLEIPIFLLKAWQFLLKHLKQDQHPMTQGMYLIP
jgi:hypothetical protein